MEQANSSQNKFEEYLEKIEAREKSRRRRTNLKWFLLVAFMGTGFVLYQQSEVKKQNLRRFAIEDLDPDIVNDLFTSESDPIIVYHPEVGYDTVGNINDYYQVLNVIDLIEMGRKAYMVIEQDEPDTTLQESLEPFIIDVAGERKVGNRLVFTVENYDPQLSYELDFGNGVVKPIKDRTTYSYPLPGHFDLTLKAVDDNGNSSTYVKKYEIISRAGQTAGNRRENANSTPTTSDRTESSSAKISRTDSKSAE